MDVGLARVQAESHLLATSLGRWTGAEARQRGVRTVLTSPSERRRLTSATVPPWGCRLPPPQLDGSSYGTGRGRSRPDLDEASTGLSALVRSPGVLLCAGDPGGVKEC